MTFAVDCPSDHVRDTVNAVFADLVEKHASGTPIVVYVEPGPAASPMTIRVGGSSTEPPRPNFTLANLVSVVSRLALDTEPERLHLHCAALAHEGSGALICAPSGTGKSTLALAMMQRGWTYESDEAVALEATSTIARGFAKPLVINANGASLLPGLDPRRVSLNSDDREWCIPAGALGARTVTEIEPAAIVILHRSPDGDTDSPPIMTPLHAADAVVALMGQTMDAERFGPDAVATLARLAASSRCVRMNVGPLDASVALLTEAVESNWEQPDVHEFPAQRSVPDQERPSWLVPPDARSVLIGDRVVVHDTIGGAIVALDEAGTAVWQALHGDAPGWWQPDMLQQASTVNFLEQLAGLGLVANGATDRSIHQ